VSSVTFCDKGMRGKVLGIEAEIARRGCGQLHHEKLPSHLRLGASYHRTDGVYSDKRHGRHKKFVWNFCEKEERGTILNDLRQ